MTWSRTRSTCQDGMIAIPEKPGLGFTMSEKFLEAHAQRRLTMKENNLLAELAAYLFAASSGETGRTPSERELAEHFSVSRGQIREALAILEAMRIVERRAKSGIYLTTTAGERRGDGAVRQGRRAARSDPDLRDRGAAGRSTRSRPPNSPARGRPRRTSSGCAKSCTNRKCGSPPARASPRRTATSTSRSCAPPRTASSTRSAASTT